MPPVEWLRNTLECGVKPLHSEASQIDADQMQSGLEVVQPRLRSLRGFLAGRIRASLMWLPGWFTASKGRGAQSPVLKCRDTARTKAGLHGIRNLLILRSCQAGQNLRLNPQYAKSMPNTPSPNRPLNLSAIFQDCNQEKILPGVIRKTECKIEMWTNRSNCFLCRAPA